MLRYAALLALLFSLGCIATTGNNGLVMGMQPDPPAIFEGTLTKVHVDVENTDTKRLENVRAEIFNSGLLEPAGECRQEMGRLLPGEFRTFACSFRAPRINQDRMQAQLDGRATFDAEFSAVQQAMLITEQEYRNRFAASGVLQQPQRYVYADRNVELQVDFSDPPPIVITPDKKFFVRFTIRNAGNGFIKAIKPEHVRIIQKASLAQDIGEGNILQTIAAENGREKYVPCQLLAELQPIGGEFPSFSCEILMPGNVRVLENFNFIVQIRYSYEVRSSAQVDILR